MINQEYGNYTNIVEQNDYLFVKKRGEIIRIPIYDIVYIESSAHKLLVHIDNDVYEYNDKMDNIEELLRKNGFIRCHQSYLVNSEKITVIRSDKLIVSGKEIRISRKYKDRVKQQISGREEKNNESKVYVSSVESHHAGSILCINGPYTGKQFILVPEQEIFIGRDGESCDIVINLPKISRKHMSVIYHKDNGCFELTDLSTNGTYVNNDIRLEKNVHYEVSSGEIVSFGDGITKFKLI